MRLWCSWSRARAPSPCNEPGRAVKPGRGGGPVITVGGPLPPTALPSAVLFPRGGGGGGGVGGRVGWAGTGSAVGLPRTACPACPPNPRTRPEGSCSWLRCCSPFSHLVPLQLPPPLHPPQNCLAGLQSQALRCWETSSCVCSTMQQLITCLRVCSCFVQCRWRWPFFDQ